MDTRMKKRLHPIYLLIFNFLIIGIIIGIFLNYVKVYNEKLHSQNLNDIRNVNQASAQIAAEISLGEERKLKNILQYQQLRQMDLTDFCQYVSDSDADDNVSFQLIGTNYKGYALNADVDGNYPTVDYSSNDYSQIHKMVDADEKDMDSIPFSVEFTDVITGLRSFSRYTDVTLEQDGVQQDYVLMAVFKSSAFINKLDISGGFNGLSSVLINADGSYALRNSEFKSETFFKYLYVYNDLTLDESNEIKEKVLSSDGGVLEYANSIGEKCVFLYSQVPGTDWNCVTVVPTSSFHTSHMDITLTSALLILFAVLMGADIIYLAELNKQLKLNVSAANAASEAKTDFLARMSHDIRTPINVINGMTELALYEDNSKETTDYLGKIQSSGKFLLGLVNDILDMNKVESGKMELHVKPYLRTDFATYINAVIAPLCQEKDIEFRLEMGGENIVLMADELRINQVFFNLLSNAVKFTQPGGHISLKIDNKKITDNRYGFDFEVKDDGSGMSKEFQKKMFVAFSQEERTEGQNRNGTGLGLAIVKNLVDLMDGTIRVESEEGKGTTFYLHIDFDVTEEETLPKHKKEKHVDLAGKRVLLCEDHPLNAEIIVQLLAHVDVLVDVAENGKLGVERFQQEKEHYYDVILMDVRMPEMNGLEAAAKIRSLEERKDAVDIPIIALTANAYDSDINDCLKAGMNSHLAKPIDPQTLYQTLMQYV